MAEYPALQLWTDAYLADTTDLSAEEHGVYLLLLMAAWRSPECSLPDDDLRLARMARVGKKKWVKMRPIMERFFTVDDRGWTQKRLLKERSRNAMYRSQKSQAGKASALKRQHTGSTGVGTGDPTGNKLPLPLPLPSKKEGTNVPSKKNGTRLQEDFILPDSWKQFARQEGWTDSAIDREADTFRDYWVAKSGQNATKRDWQATWRNWIRNNETRKGFTNGEAKQTPSLTTEELLERVRLRQQI